MTSSDPTLADLKDKMEIFMKAARVVYEETKIKFNAGECTASHLDNVRIKLEALEQSIAKLSFQTAG